MSDLFAKGVRWDLSDLYLSADDPGVEADLTHAETLAVHFEKKYKSLLKNKPGSTLSLADLMKDYKEILTVMTKPGVFSHLSFAEKTNDPAAGAYMQKIQVRLTDIAARLIFFEVQWNGLDAATAAQWLNDPTVEPDRHFLEKMRRFAPYTLNEGEEKIMAIKANTSSHAFGRLFSEVINNIPFYLDIHNQRVKKTEDEVLSLLHSPDRMERKMASESLAGGLETHTHILTYIYNMILADHRASLKIRNYKHPMDSRNLSNETDLAGVQNLMSSVKRAYPLVQRYYRLKKKLLKLDEFYDYDRYAPINATEDPLDFNQCRDIVLAGYYDFSPEAGKIVEQFFAKRWIDAEVREGKQGGGFCCETTPDLHPYILVNYTGTLRDVMTVAHECGHGLHQWLARKAGILESGAPLTLAETASVFGEMLIFEKILAKENDPKKRLSLLCGKIDDNFAAVFRQIVLTDFELLAHEAGLKEGELSSEKLSDFWIRANNAMYGKSVELTTAYRHGWKYIGHFIHVPFYCYAYAYAQLYVLSLYQRYKADKKSFIPAYFETLSLGGSKKPETIAAILSLNIRDPHFWQTGISLLEQLITEAETLAGAEV